MTKEIGRYAFDFSPYLNGGESLTLLTTFLFDGDPEPYLYQELCLNSYGNRAMFSLGSIMLTPEILRKLADELDKEISKNNEEAKKLLSIKDIIE
jgi:hypothetical protein